MILMIDNYDSFTYNLVQYLRELGERVVVARNDAIGVEDIAALRPTHLVISPGPCAPSEAGVSLAAIDAFAGRLPILGVCLGHQAVAECFGGRVVRAPAAVHGKTARITHDGRGVFEGLPQGFLAARYHSLAVDRASLPETLDVTAETDGVIMGVRHRSLCIEGVQFHPESILSEHGRQLLGNFVACRSGGDRLAAARDLRDPCAARPAKPPARREVNDLAR